MSTPTIKEIRDRLVEIGEEIDVIDALLAAGKLTKAAEHSVIAREKSERLQKIIEDARDENGEKDD